MLAACASKAAATLSATSCHDILIELTGDEDLTDEDGDIGMGNSIGVSASLGGEILSGGKKSRESNIGGGTIAGRAIITWGGGIASLISESEGTILE
ncbi:hypothetical protein Tco_0464292 [Tanacetum coccineum]